MVTVPEQPEPVESWPAGALEPATGFGQPLRVEVEVDGKATPWFSVDVDPLRVGVTAAAIARSLAKARTDARLGTLIQRGLSTLAVQASIPDLPAGKPTAVLLTGAATDRIALQPSA